MRDLHVGRSSQSSHEVQSLVTNRTANATTCRERRRRQPHRHAGGSAIQAWQRQSFGERSVYFHHRRRPGARARMRSGRSSGALASASKSKAISRTTCAIGEISLTGQVRPVPRLEYRLREAARLGFTTAVVPTLRKQIAVPGLTIVQTDTLQDALAALLR